MTQHQPFKNKTCIVTGAASGIGEATALLFAGQGANVVVSDVNAENGRTVVEKIQHQGGTASFFLLDVTDENAWSGVIDHVRGTYGRLDVLVNNAGIGFMKPIRQMTLAQWRHVLSTNLESVFLGIHHAANAMAENDPAGGAIINVSSNLIFKNPPDNAAYCASKSGVRMLTKVAAVELAELKIRVNTVFPGATLTPIWQPFMTEMNITPEDLEKVGENMTLLGRMAHADDVAGAIAYFASDTAQFVTGTELVVDGGEILRRDQKIFEAVGDAAKVVFKSS